MTKRPAGCFPARVFFKSADRNGLEVPTIASPEPGQDIRRNGAFVPYRANARFFGATSKIVARFWLRNCFSRPASFAAIDPWIKSYCLASGLPAGGGVIDAEPRLGM